MERVTEEGEIRKEGREGGKDEGEGRREGEKRVVNRDFDFGGGRGKGRSYAQWRRN